MTVSLPGVFVNVEKRGQEPIAQWPEGCFALLVTDPFYRLKQSKTGNASVIPFIGVQTLRVLRKLLLTVNHKLWNAKQSAFEERFPESVSSTRADENKRHPARGDAIESKCRTLLRTTERATKTAGSQRLPAAGRFSDAVQRLLLLCSLLRSLFNGWLSRCSCCFLRGLLCSFLCHSTFLHTKLNLSGRPAKAYRA